MLERLSINQAKRIKRLEEKLAELEGETNAFKIGDNFKIKTVSIENTILIQRTLLKHSIDFGCNFNTVIFEDHPLFLFVYTERHLVRYTDEEKFFKEYDLPEINIRQFVEIYKLNDKETNVEK